MSNREHQDDFSELAEARPGASDAADLPLWDIASAEACLVSVGRLQGGSRAAEPSGSGNSSPARRARSDAAGRPGDPPMTMQGGVPQLGHGQTFLRFIDERQLKADILALRSLLEGFCYGQTRLSRVYGDDLEAIMSRPMQLILHDLHTVGLDRFLEAEIGPSSAHRNDPNFNILVARRTYAYRRRVHDFRAEYWHSVCQSSPCMQMAMQDPAMSVGRILELWVGELMLRLPPWMREGGHANIL